jgi:hypothetical protein
VTRSSATHRARRCCRAGPPRGKKTTAGTLNDIAAIGAAVRAHDPAVSLIVDSMSGFGCHAIDLDASNVSYLVSSANKVRRDASATRPQTERDTIRPQTERDAIQPQIERDAIRPQKQRTLRDTTIRECVWSPFRIAPEASALERRKTAKEGRVARRRKNRTRGPPPIISKRRADG